MTGGRLLHVAKYLEGGQPFCMTYGDGLANIDIAAEIAFHQQRGLKATVACVRPPRASAAHDRRHAGEILRRKPQAEGGLINGGFFVLEPTCWNSSTVRKLFGKRSPWSLWPPRASLPPGCIGASGSRWILCATNIT